MIEKRCEDHSTTKLGVEMQCPVCLEDGLRAAKAATELVILFHSAGEWDADKRMDWTNRMVAILGPGNHRDEATTKNLCDAMRAVLKEV